MRLIVRWLITALALAIAAKIVPGVHMDDSTNAWIAVGATAIILGLVNALIRPILTTLSCGLIVVTLGLFTFVINAVVFWLAATISSSLGFGFSVTDFWAALGGSIIVSIVSFIASLVLPDEQRSRRTRL